MSIVRMIVTTVPPGMGNQAERNWKEKCAPLMIKQPGCLSERMLRSKDNPGEYISCGVGQRGEYSRVPEKRGSPGDQAAQHEHHGCKGGGEGIRHSSLMRSQRSRSAMQSRLIGNKRT
jgi:hypothetical protein